MSTHEDYINQALVLAKAAYDNGDVPVGAVLVMDDQVIGIGFNTRDSKGDIFGHAEMHALNQAALALGSWRLDGATLYSTLEPCPMCAGAALQSRVERIVFGAYDKKAGCCGSLYNLPADNRFSHRVEVIGGVLHEECSQLLKEFFAEKRLDTDTVY